MIKSNPPRMSILFPPFHSPSNPSNPIINLFLFICQKFTIFSRTSYFSLSAVMYNRCRYLPSYEVLSEIFLYINESIPHENNIGLVQGSNRAHTLNTFRNMANFKLMQHSNPKHILSNVQYTFFGILNDSKGHPTKRMDFECKFVNTHCYEYSPLPHHTCT